MTEVTLPYLPPIRRIFHPSDLSPASRSAFAHALKLALLAQAELNILHVTESMSEVAWTDFPGVRETLKSWSVLQPESSETDVSRLGLRVRKVVASHTDPVKASLRFLRRHPADLVVLATRRRAGRMRWMRTSVAEPIARASEEMTLFVPHGVGGFVSLQDGGIFLTNVLIPVDHKPSPGTAVEAAACLAAIIGLAGVRCTVLHVGKQEDTPSLQLPDLPDWTWRWETARGDVVEAILQTAAQVRADLLIMATAGHNGFLDALRGSTTERVLRGVRCPLLAIPARFSISRIPVSDHAK